MDSDKIQTLRKLSDEIDELYGCGKDAEGEKKLYQALEKAKKIKKAYNDLL